MTRREADTGDGVPPNVSHAWWRDRVLAVRLSNAVLVLNLPDLVKIAALAGFDETIGVRF